MSCQEQAPSDLLIDFRPVCITFPADILKQSFSSVNSVLALAVQHFPLGGISFGTRDDRHTCLLSSVAKSLRLQPNGGRLP